MRQRSALRNGIEYCLALGVVKSLEWAPLGLAHWLARRYAGLLDLAIPRLRRVAYRNLAMALPEADHRRIVDGVSRSIARILGSIARFPSIRKQNLSQWIHCEGGEHFESALREEGNRANVTRIRAIERKTPSTIRRWSASGNAIARLRYATRRNLGIARSSRPA